MNNSVLVLAPHGRDAAVAVELMHRHGIAAKSCDTLQALAHCLEQGAGAALVAEEALAADELATVTDWLSRQPPWSDFPFVVLANGHKGVRSARAFETLDQMRPHRLIEIEHFFQTYKALEDKAVDVVGWRDRDRALDVLRTDRVAWQRETGSNAE